MTKEKKKAGNRRKQDLRDQQEKRKSSLQFILKILVKVLIAAAALYIIYPVVTNFHMPTWLKPQTTNTKKAIEPQEAYHIEYNFYSLLPQEKVVAPKEFTSTANSTLVIQVASFKTKTHAKKMQQRLKKLGFKLVSHDVVKNKKGTWFRVNIGPLKNIIEAERTQSNLELKGIKKSVIKSTLKQ